MSSGLLRSIREQVGRRITFELRFMAIFEGFLGLHVSIWDWDLGVWCFGEKEGIMIIFDSNIIHPSIFIVVYHATMNGCPKVSI